MARPVGKCALCLRTRELADSHLIPAGMYRISRGDGTRPGNQNPFLITPNMCLQTSEQASDYLLCDGCEERFNRNGERWMIANCYRESDNVFPLRNKLANVQPFIWVGGEGGFDTANIEGIDHAKIIYYALSVFWRAAVHRWPARKERLEFINLGPYREKIRRFLIGEESLSQDIYLSIWLSTRDRPIIGSNAPKSFRVESGGILHRMNIPGIAFMLTIGKVVDSSARRTCIIRVPNRPMFVSRHVDDELISNLLATVRRHP